MFLYVHIESQTRPTASVAAPGVGNSSDSCVDRSERVLVEAKAWRSARAQVMRLAPGWRQFLKQTDFAKPSNMNLFPGELVDVYIGE